MKSSDELLEWPRLVARVAQFTESPLGRAQADRLQPLDDANKRENTQAALQYCLRHPKWRLSIQMHKILGIE